jgi:uncharacterized RDD family membrane protein YckC
MSDGYEIVCQTCRSPFPANLDACPACQTNTAAPRGTGPSVPSPFPRHVLAADPSPAAAATVLSNSLGVPRTREVRYGGFWIRVAASLVDWLILVIAGYVIDQSLGAGLAAFVNLLLGWLYYTYLESSSAQGTMGKVLFGLAVTNERGERIGFGRANGRYWAKILSTLTLGIGFLMVGWTQRKQGLHDFVAGTLVVRR